MRGGNLATHHGCLLSGSEFARLAVGGRPCAQDAMFAWRARADTHRPTLAVHRNLLVSRRCCWQVGRARRVAEFCVLEPCSYWRGCSRPKTDEVEWHAPRVDCFELPQRGRFGPARGVRTSQCRLAAPQSVCRTLGEAACAPLPRQEVVRLDDDSMWVNLDDGRVIAVPLAWFRWLLIAAPELRTQFVLSPCGIHWEVLDEDVSIDGR